MQAVLLFVLTILAAAVEPAQVVTGVVIDGKSQKPVFGAVVAAPDGKRLAVSDRAGRFRVAGAKVSSIRVSAPQFAAKTIDIPPPQRSVELGRVFLWRSATLTVSVAPPGLSHLAWSLERAEPGAKATQKIRDGRFVDGVATAVIEGIEPARYLLRVRGDGPLQQIATPVSVEPGEVRNLSVLISPVTVDLEVTRGEKALPGAIVRFDHADYLWNGEVQCGDDGKAAAELWQAGKFWLFTKASGAAVDGQLRDLPHDRSHVSVELTLPAHSIHGEVIDASTGTPLSDVNLSLETAAKGTRTNKSDGDGKFVFEAVPEGRHTIRAYKRGYRYDRPFRVAVSADDDEIEQTIALVPDSTARQVQVLDPNGAPVVAAKTFFGFGAAVQMLEDTDATGTVNVPEGTGVLFVVPETGSFGYRMIRAADESPLVLRVPAGTAAMTITSESSSHQPIPYVFFALRAEGTLLPPAVIQRLGITQRLPFRTDADGRAQLTGLPPGRYDIWPVRTREEMEAIFRGGGQAPAATVVLGSETANVVLTFERLTRP